MSAAMTVRPRACGQVQRVGGAAQLPGPDPSHLCSALQELQLDADPGVQRAALETLKILDTCSQHRLLTFPKGIS